MVPVTKAALFGQRSTVTWETEGTMRCNTCRHRMFKERDEWLDETRDVKIQAVGETMPGVGG